MAAPPRAPRPSPTTHRGAAWRGIWTSAVQRAQFIAEASIGGRLHLRPGPAPLQLEPEGITPRRGQGLRNRRPRASTSGWKAGRPGPEARGAGLGPEARSPGRAIKTSAAARVRQLDQGPGSPRRRSSASAGTKLAPIPASRPRPARAPRRAPERRSPADSRAAPELRFASRAPPPTPPPPLLLVRGRCPGAAGAWVGGRRFAGPGSRPAGDAGPQGGNFGPPPLAAFARGRRSPPGARPPPARAHTRASHTAAPRTAPPRTPRSAPPAVARGRRAPRGPCPPRPIAPQLCAAALGSAASGSRRGGAEGRASGRVGDRRQKRGGPGKAAPSLRPSRAGSALGAGRGGRGAAGAGRRRPRAALPLGVAVA